MSGVTAHLFVRSGCEFILLIEETTSDVVGHYRCHLDPDHAGVILVLASKCTLYQGGREGGRGGEEGREGGEEGREEGREL